MAQVSVDVSEPGHSILQDDRCAQRRLRPACASAQSSQNSSQGTLWVAKDPTRIQADGESAYPLRLRTRNLIGNAVPRLIFCHSGS